MRNLKKIFKGFFLKEKQIVFYPIHWHQCFVAIASVYNLKEGNYCNTIKFIKLEKVFYKKGEGAIEHLVRREKVVVLKEYCFSSIAECEKAWKPFYHA